MTTAYVLKSLKQVSKQEVPEGMRLLRVIHKGKEKESQGCFVPVVSDAMTQALLVKQEGLEWIKHQLQGVQEQIVRALGRDTFSSDQIGHDAILAYLTAENVRERFSKESIAEWFKSDMASHLVTALHAKGITDDAKLAQILGSFLASFQLLAGRDPSMPEAIKDQLIKALNLLPEGYENPTAEKIAEKLNAVKEASAIIDAL